jgi:hypothetical protein
MCPPELRPIPPTAHDHVAGPVTRHPRSAMRGPTYLPLSRCLSTSAGRSHTTIPTRAAIPGRLYTVFHHLLVHTFLFSSCISWLPQQTTFALLATRDSFCHAFGFGYRMIPTWLYTFDSCHGHFHLGIHYSGLRVLFVRHSGLGLVSGCGHVRLRRLACDLVFSGS